MHFSFFYPYAFLLLALLPCFVWCRQKAKVVYFPKEEWLPKQSFAWDNVLLWIISIYMLLVFAIAAPFTYTTENASQKKGRDLVLVLDTSGSMAERGFNKKDTYSFNKL